MRLSVVNASKTAYLVGTILALVHLILSWYIIIGLGLNEPDAQWQLIWIVLLPFDFPFSLLVLFSGYLFPDWSFSSFPYPVSEFRSFILPAFVHGIIGPIWYFMLPIFISILRRRYKEKRGVEVT